MSNLIYNEKTGNFEEMQANIQSHNHVPSCSNSSKTYKSNMPATLINHPNNHIRVNCEKIWKYYCENKSFAARKFFVDAYRCSWEEASRLLNEAVRGTAEQYIKNNSHEIIDLYMQGKTFAARKFFVDAYECSWEKASKLLDKVIQDSAKQYIQYNLSEIKRLYKQGKTFAARKFFVDAYGCSWDEAYRLLNDVV